jgi:hypothetical protein
MTEKSTDAENFTRLLNITCRCETAEKISVMLHKICLSILLHGTETWT